MTIAIECHSRSGDSAAAATLIENRCCTRAALNNIMLNCGDRLSPEELVMAGELFPRSSSDRGIDFGSVARTIR
jgi:hypothetical protein